MVLHQLHDDPDLLAAILDTDDAHYVGSVLLITVAALLVGEYKACCSVLEVSQLIIHSRNLARSSSPLTVGLLNFDPLQINGIHHRTLKELDSGEVALYQTLELQVWRLPVQKHHFHVDVLAVFVQEIFEKVADALVGYVATDNNVPGRLMRADCGLQLLSIEIDRREQSQFILTRAFGCGRGELLWGGHKIGGILRN